MEKQIDPRILRTRKLIMDAFIELSMKKDFKDITIKDITTTALLIVQPFIIISLTNMTCLKRC
ncbi:hypothetical protein [Bacillus sp. V59.32b]|uniref:hypothetical protein n=1 Tax=Bacillus sp. V59.32b TaxID=1758642 RepID=UPI0020B152D5|nr:hypothetical protein [Bacillus sp. V59.32b]